MDQEPQPVVDAVVFKPISKEINSYQLPYRQLYNVEVLDCATGTIPQALDTLKTAGPFQVRGWVPLEETALPMVNYKGNEKGRLLFIKAECIVEWTHEYNHQNPMRPKFWVLSNNICWYQIQSVKDSYEPYFEPLVDVSAYLNAIIHVVTTQRVRDELDVLVPAVASLLSQPAATVREKLVLHRDRMMDLCSSDSALRKLAFYKNWIQEKANKQSDQSSRDHHAPTIQTVSSAQTTHSTGSKDYVMEEYEDSAHYVRGHTGWSAVSIFQCPIQNCLCTISNAVFSSANEFAATIMQHISKHDHSKSDIKALLKAYLVQTQNLSVEPAGQDTEARDPNATVRTKDRSEDMRTDSKKYHTPTSAFFSDTPLPSDDGSAVSSEPTPLEPPQSYGNSPLGHTGDDDDHFNSLQISTPMESSQKRRHGENTESDEQSLESGHSRLWYRTSKRRIRRPLYMEEYLDEYTESDTASSDGCLSDNVSRPEPIEIDSDSEESIYASDDSDGARVSAPIQEDNFSLSYVYEPYLRCRECRRLMKNANGHLCKRD
ncbi:hypothetical protein BGZ51_002156 [Haplosporangium sp. Z 767]|nr:hypothetical protein BGZ51_002156 [Haplosporangium sp. Z 767]